MENTLTKRFRKSLNAEWLYTIKKEVWNEQEDEEYSQLLEESYETAAFYSLHYDHST